jgi:hypothetical protein
MIADQEKVVIKFVKKHFVASTYVHTKVVI